jgi:hypothetical protein
MQNSNWQVSYEWSESSGLRLGKSSYGGIQVIHNASVPFVYVDYQGNAAGPFTDELRSTSSKVEVREIMNGFDLKVTYDIYGPDYQYDHVWRFHDDGQFGAIIVIQGPGEEIDGRHAYHLPFRFDLDVSGASGDSFQRKLGNGNWQDVAYEGRHFPSPLWAQDYAWRVIDKASGRCAMVRPRAMDHAELWALRYRPVESWAAWGAAAPGVPGDAGSVPAVYADGQSVQDGNLVLWYIAHIPSVERVAACGPWFRLQGYPQAHDDDGDGGHHHEHGHGPPDH